MAPCAKHPMLSKKSPRVSKVKSLCTREFAVFLAVFAYYEFSRQRLSVANTELVPAYAMLLMGTFALSVVVVVHNAMLQRSI